MNYDTKEKQGKRLQEIAKSLIEKAEPLNWAWNKLESLGYDGDRSERDYIMEEPKRVKRIEPDENGLWPEETLLLNN